MIESATMDLEWHGLGLKLYKIFIPRKYILQ